MCQVFPKPKLLMLKALAVVASHQDRKLSIRIQRATVDHFAVVDRIAIPSWTTKMQRCIRVDVWGRFITTAAGWICLPGTTAWVQLEYPRKIASWSRGKDRSRGQEEDLATEGWAVGTCDERRRGRNEGTHHCARWRQGQSEAGAGSLKNERCRCESAAKCYDGRQSKES